ncbi:MAG TPA: NAD(P)-dependent oxidoreductase [Candidatus Binataceae bacterium]|nr:NAD(P)-dependent oxidoreductase [Candidatus Binataceae bacterium]
MKVGFIGLGAMGKPMALHLTQAGNEVAVYNRSSGQTAELEKAGARVAQSPADAATGAEVVMTMIADDSALEAVMFAGGALKSMNRGALHVSFSTISPDMSKRLEQAHAAAGQHYVSAPVFGRPEAAAAKRLWVVAAGAPADIERCRPLLEAVGQGVIVVGDQPWVSNVVKIAGNFMIISAIESLAEAFVLVRKAGVRPERFLEIFNGNLFKSPVVQNYGMIMAEERFDPPGFKLRLGLKDVNLAVAAAKMLGASMPMGEVLVRQFEDAISRGMGEIDWSALARLNAQNANLEPRSKSAS